MTSPIVVCLKEVGTTDVPLRLGEGEALRDEAPRRTNRADLAALRLSREISHQGADAHPVIALTVAPPAAEEPLRVALAVGASRALRVWNSGWPVGSTLGTGSAERRFLHAAAAAQAIRPLGAALVLTGESSEDGGHGCFAAFLAHELSAALAMGAVGLSARAGGWLAKVKLDRGYTQEMELSPPAVVSVAAALPLPPEPSLPAWMDSRRAAISEIECDLQAAGEAASVLRRPIPRVKHQPLPDRDDSADARIDAMMRQGVSQRGRVVGAEMEAAAQAAEIFEFLASRGF